MPLRVTGLRLPLDRREGEVISLALQEAGIGADELLSAEIVRRSQDRRGRIPILCYTVDLHLRDASAPRTRTRTGSRVRDVALPRMVEPTVGEQPLAHRPVIVGTGPAGLFAGLWLARAGFAPLLLERGDRMSARVRSIRNLNREGAFDPESNYLFGEGGAGTFSDGKLTCRSKDGRARFVLEEFRAKSGVPRVAYDYRPHLGSDRVRAVVGRIRQEILALGGALRFRCRVDRLLLRDGVVRGLATSEGEIPADAVILAPGHSARDLVRSLLADGVPLEARPFQFGVRIEHPQVWVDDAVYGSLAGRDDLGSADYRLVARLGAASVYSFCMCPGGEIIPAISDLAHMSTNGMSWSRRDTGFANSGLVTTILPSGLPGRGPLAGLEFQEHFEARAASAVGGGLAVPAQRLGDYLRHRPTTSLPAHSCRSGAVPVRLAALLPRFLDRLLRRALPHFERQMEGFQDPGALLVGPESRSSSPLRILRDPESHESPGVHGLYPAGEGAGYAGGIVSSAVDGLRAAQAVGARYRPAAGAPGP